MRRGQTGVYRFHGLLDHEAQGPGAAAGAHLNGALIGRERQLRFLERQWQHVCRGERRLILVGGNAGVGKTTLIDAFCAQLRTERTSVGWGQCLEHAGAGEAYLPVLECLGRLGQGPQRERWRQVMGQYAPSWLIHLPSWVGELEWPQLQLKVQGTTRARMVRELAKALDVLSADVPLVLVIEDLHWSDPSTIDLLNVLLQRREPAKLLLLGTYRQGELDATQHPLGQVLQELLSWDQGHALRLEAFGQDELPRYAMHRLGAAVEPVLVDLLSARTGGNALFVSALLAHLKQDVVV